MAPPPAAVSAATPPIAAAIPDPAAATPATRWKSTTCRSNKQHLGLAETPASTPVRLIAHEPIGKEDHTIMSSEERAPREDRPERSEGGDRPSRPAPRRYGGGRRKVCRFCVDHVK